MKNLKTTIILAFLLITISANSQNPQRMLMESVLSGNIEAVEYWISQGANINKKYVGEYSVNGMDFETTKLNEMPLHAALAASNADMIVFLLDKGADPDVENGFGSSPIQYLATKSHNLVMQNKDCGFESNRDIKIAQALVNKKADLNGKVFGKRTLTLAKEYSKYRPTDKDGFIAFLIRNGAKE
jgi:hypothetical protein